MRCEAITKGGGRCRLDATHGSYCWSHAPETAEARKRRASRAGRAGGNGRPGTGEISDVKKQITATIGGVLSGRIERGTGSVMFMGFNTLLRAVEVERRIKETQEFEERLAALEALEQTGASEAAPQGWWHR